MFDIYNVLVIQQMIYIRIPFFLHRIKVIKSRLNETIKAKASFMLIFVVAISRLRNLFSHLKLIYLIRTPWGFSFTCKLPLFLLWTRNTPQELQSFRICSNMLQ